MSKKREEPKGRREGRTGGYGRSETPNKFYSNVVKRKDAGDRPDERKERSFDKPRGERPPSDERRFDDKRSERPRTGGSNYAGSRPDRPRFERSDDRRSSGPSSGRPGQDRPDRNRDERPRSDSPRGGRFEGGGPRRDFDRSRGPRDENKGFRRDDRSDRNDTRSSRFGGSNSRDDKPRFGRSGGQSETRNSRFGSEKSFGDRSRDDDSRPKADRPERRENRFGAERSYGERTERSRDVEPRADRDAELGAEPRERRESDRPRRDDRPFTAERRDFDRPRRDDSAPRDDRPADRERRDFDRPQGPRDENKGFRRDERPFTSERRDFDRPRRDDRPGDSDRPSRDDRESRYDRPRRDDNDEAKQQKIEASRSRQVGRSREPEYDINKMKEQVLGSRNPRDKKTKRSGHERPGHDRPSRDQPGSSERNTDKTPHSSESGLIRLNRYIANAGICSRRDADELIAKGDVSVNGKVVTEMGYKVQPTDVIKYGNRVLNPEKMTYVLLNKPKDYITTTDDPNDRNTVMDLVAGATPYRIYPVGRLDRNTTGLLLLTNDGELVEKLTHPSNEIKKVYQVELDKPLTNEHFEAIRDGFELEDGYIKPDDLGIVTPDAQVIGIEIHSGRNRIVRRIFENFGYEVTKLDRTVYAGLNKKELPRGTWRYLNEKEVIRLKFLL
jgi:23S rRNA pseudouridine2605 synthase